MITIELFNKKYEITSNLKIHHASRPNPTWYSHDIKNRGPRNSRGKGPWNEFSHHNFPRYSHDNRFVIRNPRRNNPPAEGPQNESSHPNHSRYSRAFLLLKGTLDLAILMLKAHRMSVHMSLKSSKATSIWNRFIIVGKKCELTNERKKN